MKDIFRLNGTPEINMWIDDSVAIWANLSAMSFVI